jgi:predicted nucleic acid-binding protein
LTRLVVDASVSAAWFLPDEATAYTESVLRATATHEVWVPSLWVLEIANLLATAQRRRRIDDAKRVELASAAAGLRVRVDRETVSIRDIGDLAARHALTAYDAAYLELALRRKLPLATIDAALMKAMKAADVPLADV